jgi:hypothetical protein
VVGGQGHRRLEGVVGWQLGWKLGVNLGRCCGGLGVRSLVRRVGRVVRRRGGRVARRHRGR